MSTTSSAEVLLRAVRDGAASRSGDAPANGRQPPHAFGVWASGAFTPSPMMRRFAAPMFAGPDTPVHLRFSSMNGGPAGRDVGPNNLGLAIRFGDRGDLTATNAALFPAKDREVFLEFLKEVPVPQAGGSTPPVIGFLGRNPGSIAATVAYGRSRARGRPPSFAETTYHGQHAYRLASARNEDTVVRYRWAPAAGDRGGRSWGDPAWALRDELIERLKGGPVHFTLMLEVAGYGQHVDDPSEFWPETLERLIAGVLAITEPSDPPPAVAAAPFLPDEPPAGWEPVKGDRVMEARREVYALARRGGAPPSGSAGAATTCL